MRNDQTGPANSFSQIPMTTEVCYKDLYAQLKKLDKSFREIESTQRKYNKNTKRMLNNNQTAELDDKSSQHIAELYNDFCNSLSRGEKYVICSLCYRYVFKSI